MVPPTRHRLPPLLLALLLGAACSDDPESVAPLECDHNQDVFVSVEQDILTRFTWEPGCGMASILVSGAGGGWVVYSGSNSADNPIASGVMYGVAPDGTLEPSPATPLVSGEEYTVTVSRWIGEPGGPGSLFPAGSTYFQAR